MIHVRLLKSFLVSGGSDLDSHTDAVMDELIKLEGRNIMDADLSADLDRHIVELSVIASAESFDEAVSCADAAIRTAIHAAGGSTPKWGRVNYEPQKSEADLVTA